MDNLIGSRICGGNPAGKRKKSDFYPTPPEATQALLDFLRIDRRANIWEPAGKAEGGLTMDLTNIKPCVECTSFRMCIKCSCFDELAVSRMSRLLVLGEDCFEEVDDG